MKSFGVRQPKDGQLRVRITDDERKALEKIVSESGGTATLSDVIRLALETMLDPSRVPMAISVDTSKALHRLCATLNRTPEAVLADCVAGIEAQITSSDKHTPLIVQEGKLRLEYEATKKKNHQPK